MASPKLFLVAGPNGSGKSLFSKELTSSDFEVFDGDKYMAALVRNFPETGSEALWSYINDTLFSQEKKKAISSRLNYAFETNFSSSDPMNTAREFQKEGYEIHLIFLGVNSIEESFQRVADRVRNGGHKVSEESIKYNFKFGLVNLYKFYSEFDSVTLFNNAVPKADKPTTPKEILHIINGVIRLRTKICPNWAKPIIEYPATGKFP